MINEQAYSEFLNGLNEYSLKNVVEFIDLYIYPNIPEDVKYSVRNKFDLNIKEEILYVRDTSFWSNRNQGTVVTDARIVIIPDNDSPLERLDFNWDIIKKVEYNSECLYFYGYEGEDDYSAVHWKHLLRGDNDFNNVIASKFLARIFTRMAQTQIKETFNEILERTKLEYNQLIENGKEEDALSVALKFREEQRCVNFTFDIAKYYMNKRQYEKAISILNEDIDALPDDSDYWRSVLNITRSVIYDTIGNSVKARMCCFEAKQKATQDMEFQNKSVLDEAIECFEDIEKNLKEHFLELPYQERKLLVPVESYSDLSQKTLTVLNINNLPAIKFSIGHPIANQLYVGHPYLPSKYIPFENYQLEFIEDRVREFCQIMQYLGALEIKIECINSFLDRKDSQINQKGGGSIDSIIAQISINAENDRNNKFINDISRSIKLHQKYQPKLNPKLPSNLVWYPNEPSWQRLYDQRMQGAIVEYEERIETKKSQVVENSQLVQIEAEVKRLFLEAKGNWVQSMEKMFETHENAVLAIHVKFASLETLQKANSIDVKVETDKVKVKETFKGFINTAKEKARRFLSVNKALVSNEEEYLIEVKACLEEDGEISLRERRFLSRLREKLGISEERAVELETLLVQTQLTEEEQEYLEEYKACLDEDGEISPKERRLLDLLRDKLGISEERTKEIERMN